MICPPPEAKKNDHGPLNLGEVVKQVLWPHATQPASYLAAR